MDKNDKMDNPRNSPDINNGRNTTFNNAVDFLGDVTLFKDVTSVKIITDEIGSSSGQLNISSDVNITGTASVKEVFEKVNQRKETSGTKNIDISAGSLHFFSEYATGNCVINELCNLNIKSFVYELLPWLPVIPLKYLKSL